MSERERKASQWVGIIFGMMLLRRVADFWLPVTMHQYSYFEVALSLGLIAYLFNQPKTIKKTPLKYQVRVYVNALIYLMIYIATFIGLGFVDGFGKNALDTSLIGVGSNLLFFTPTLILFEFVRDRVLNTVRKRWHVVFQIVLIVLGTLMTIKTLQWKMFITGNLETRLDFLGTTFLANICLQTFLNIVVMKGGVGASCLIRVGLIGMAYVFPVLPNLKWITEVLLNVLFPVLGISLVGRGTPNRHDDKAIAKEEKNGSLSTFGWGVASIIVVWFSLGIFPVFPTVILTGSMEPYIMPGDVVILQKVDTNALKTGDVIQFWSEGIYIVHRIIGVEKNGYHTKGDNNNAPDSDLVLEGHVRGKMIYKIPALGKPIVYMKTRDKDSLDFVRDRFELGGD